VTATLRLDAPRAARGGGVQADVGLVALSDAAGTAIEELGDQTLLLDGPGGAAVASGTLTHFSLAAFASRNPVTGNVVARVSAMPSRTVVLVGQPFTVDVIFELFDVRGGRTPVSHRDEALRTGAVRCRGPRRAHRRRDAERAARAADARGLLLRRLRLRRLRGRVTAGELPPSVQFQVGIDCVQALPTTTTTTRPSTSMTRPPTATTRPSTSTSTSDEHVVQLDQHQLDQHHEHEQHDDDHHRLLRVRAGLRERGDGHRAALRVGDHGLQPRPRASSSRSRSATSRAAATACAS
jgi:hypothetical protein